MAVADVLIDTSGFLALWDAADAYHDRALRLQSELVRKKRRFLTTDYIADETATLLLVRHSHFAATDFLDSILGSSAVQLEWTGPDRFHTSAALFKRYQDKDWSFTDCVSFSLMRELNIAEAFTTDHHFKQAGFRRLLAEE